MIKAATLLGFALPFAAPQTWPTDLDWWRGHEVSAIVSPGITGGGSIQDACQSVSVIAPVDLVPDRSNFSRRAAASLIEYATLGPNWDGEGAAPPAPEAVHWALRMLEVTPIEVGAPNAMVLPTGEVAIYWDRGQVYAEIGFDALGTYFAFATAPGMERVYLDDVPVEDERGAAVFPREIRDVLTYGDV